MWVCNNCGHTNGDNANHCKYCNAQKHVERKKHVSIIIPIIMNVALILIVFSFWVHEYRDNQIDNPVSTPLVDKLDQLLVSESSRPSLNQVETIPPTASSVSLTPNGTTVPSIEVKVTTTPKPTSPPKPITSPTPVPFPSRDDLDKIGSKIDYPAENNFLKEYRYATIKAPRSGWSVYGFKHLLREDNATNPDYNIEDGTRVTVLSSNVYGFVCCILEHKNIACWINEKYVAYQN